MLTFQQPPTYLHTLHGPKINFPLSMTIVAKETVTEAQLAVTQFFWPRSSPAAEVPVPASIVYLFKAPVQYLCEMTVIAKDMAGLISWMVVASADLLCT